MSDAATFARLSAEEAASLVSHGDLVAFSGFTPAGAAKAVPRALAAAARRRHARGEAFQIRVLTGASTGKSLDDALAEADAISWRAPYQASAPLRERINDGRSCFIDLHLSHLPQAVLCGFFGKLDLAVVEATEITPDGRVFLTSSIGASPTYLQCAEKVVIELNRYHSPRLREMADILVLPPPPHRDPIPIEHPLARIGRPYATVDPRKVVGVVETNEPDEAHSFHSADVASRLIADQLVEFLLSEMANGQIPSEFLPLQAGVGNVANAVMEGLGMHPDIPPFTMYTEVFQDSLVDLIERGRLTAASCTSLTLSEACLQRVYANMDSFTSRITLRPQELSNHPAVIRRLGVIAANTVLEVDIYGHANSTHVCGSKMVNGIGGSGDFERNAYLSILMCPSVAKGGRVSTVVPMCTHVDHSEHSVQVIVTEQGLADLRGLGPQERAATIIDRCAHPAYRDYLHRYVRDAPPGHIRHDLARAFELHRNLLEQGAMLPQLDLSQFQATGAPAKGGSHAARAATAN